MIRFNTLPAGRSTAVSCSLLLTLVLASPVFAQDANGIDIVSGNGWRVEENSGRTGGWLWEAGGKSGKAPTQQDAIKAAKEAKREAKREARQERKLERQEARAEKKLKKRANGVMAGPCGPGQSPDGPDGLCSDSTLGGGGMQMSTDQMSPSGIR